MVLCWKVNIILTMLYEAKCPECNKRAHGEDQVIERFGIRNNHGYKMVQSWCRKCRNRQAKERYLSRK